MMREEPRETAGCDWTKSSRNWMFHEVSHREVDNKLLACLLSSNGDEILWLSLVPRILQCWKINVERARCKWTGISAVEVNIENERFTVVFSRYHYRWWTKYWPPVHGLPQWKTLKWTSPKNSNPNEYYLMFLADSLIKPHITSAYVHPVSHQPPVWIIVLEITAKHKLAQKA